MNFSSALTKMSVYESVIQIVRTVNFANTSNTEWSEKKTEGLSKHCYPSDDIQGCILLGISWLFSFRIRNNRIHEISFLKRMQIMKMEYFWQSELGTIVFEHAPVELAWRLKKVS